MDSYTAIAPFYDGLTADVDYTAFYAYYRRILKRYRQQPEIVLDACCGTGSLTALFAQDGFETIGVDASFDMLGVAREKVGRLQNPPLFLHQPLHRLDLYGTVSLAVSSLDSINYILDERKLQKSFERVALFLEPDCLFIFDISSEHKLRGLHGQVIVKESADCLCLWQSRYSARHRLATHLLDLFVQTDETGERYLRYQEEQRQRVYDPQKLKDMLRAAGFRRVDMYGAFCFSAPKPDEQRIFLVAQK